MPIVKSAKQAFEFARMQYMSILRQSGRTNAQIARATGVSPATVLKVLGYQPAEINKVSFSKRGKNAAATRLSNRNQALELAKKTDIEMIDAKIAMLKAERDVKLKSLADYAEA